MHKIIDSHCHLNFPQFDGKVDEIVKRALKNGVYRMLTISTKLSEINKLFKKKNSFKGKIGIFDVEDNKINHRLNFYEVNEGKFKKIF